jgi:signal transduction histidine kinase
MSATPPRTLAPGFPLGLQRLRTSPLLLDLRNVALFSAVYLAAYGCSRFFALRTGARLWLPDSILLCTLLLAPRKKWWLYVLMALPIRFVPGVRAQVAAWFLCLTWSNDALKGILAACLLQRGSGDSIRFDSVRRYATYLGIAVLLAPAFSALFGALTRSLALGHSFWPAFGQWFLGDALANLVVTPALWLWLSREYRRLRPRSLEAVLWAASFALCLCFMLLTWSNESILAFYAPFPFLVWAALRMGTIGASSGLFLTTVFLMFGISRRQGPLFSLMARDMHFLQLLLAILALPIMFTAILFEERRQAEARLLESQEKLRQNYKRTRDLAGWLIQAQEEERRRIARDLHDDISQQIALMAIRLDALECAAPGQPAAVHDQLSDLKRKTEEIALGVRDVARQLHSTTLQHLGLVKALQGLCRTFSQQHQITVNLDAEPIEGLSDHVSLCLFRVAQEALNNAVNHGHATQITVSLAREAGGLRLRIKDAGTGFEPAATPEGLGLVSMQERLRLVGGKLVIQSSPGEGALVEAVVDQLEK